MSDVMSAYGSLKPKRPIASIEEETEAMEKAVGREVAERFEKSFKTETGLKFPGFAKLKKRGK